jgi:hypothetical protein
MNNNCKLFIEYFKTQTNRVDCSSSIILANCFYFLIFITYPGVSPKLCFEVLIEMPIHDNGEDIPHCIIGKWLDSNNIEMA